MRKARQSEDLRFLSLFLTEGEVTESAIKLNELVQVVRHQDLPNTPTLGTLAEDHTVSEVAIKRRSGLDAIAMITCQAKLKVTFCIEGLRRLSAAVILTVVPCSTCDSCDRMGLCQTDVPSMPDRTELQWFYSPADFFEAPYLEEETGHSISIADGVAKATLQGPAAIGADEVLARKIKALFQIRQMQTNRRFELERLPSVTVFRGGTRHFILTTEPGIIRVTGTDVDVIATDAKGEVVRDTRAERIAVHNAELNSISGKAARSELLRGMLDSYQRSINDPANALVHLYEVRDALAEHCGGAATAVQTLGISKRAWDDLGRLANNEPVAEGRHRGKHGENLRTATPAELMRVREAA
jgi:hypothetical protein